MKFLPPAAALQLTQKTSKAAESAAAIAEVPLRAASAPVNSRLFSSRFLLQAAAEAVGSAQELVAESKRALKKAEDSCSRLIGTRIAGCLAYRAVLAGFDTAGNCLCRGKARH